MVDFWLEILVSEFPAKRKIIFICKPPSGGFFYPLLWSNQIYVSYLNS